VSDKNENKINWKEPPYINPSQSLIIDIYNKLEQGDMSLEEFRARWVEILTDMTDHINDLESELDLETRVAEHRGDIIVANQTLWDKTDDEIKVLRIKIKKLRNRIRKLMVAKASILAKELQVDVEMWKKSQSDTYRYADQLRDEKEALEAECAKLKEQNEFLENRNKEHAVEWLTKLRDDRVKDLESRLTEAEKDRDWWKQLTGCYKIGINHLRQKYWKSETHNHNISNLIEEWRGSLPVSFVLLVEEELK